MAHPSTAIEVVDLSPLAQAGAGGIERVAAALEGPCTRLGVFHVVGHGLSTERLTAFDAAVRALFALPLEAKRAARRTRDNAWGWYDAELTKNRPDWKEIFDFGPERPASGTPDDDDRTRHSDGRNQWPVGAEVLRPVLLEHHAACRRVALELLRALSVGLGLAPDRLVSAFDVDSSFLRLNHYAPCPDAAPPDAPWFPDRGPLAVHHHSDAGALTVLYQDAVPGLQVWTGERFEGVAPVEGALTVNLGDVLQVWSNDRYRSPVHRVVADRTRTRISAPFFLNPGYDTVYAPILEGDRKGDSPCYAPIAWATFRDRRSAGDYADYGAEIQIEDYRLGSTVEDPRRPAISARPAPAPARPSGAGAEPAESATRA